LLLSVVLFGWTYFYCHPTTAKTLPQREVQHDFTPEIEVAPVKTAIIEMQLATWCGPCKRLKASGAIKELEKSGWTIKYTDGIGSSYPSFRVWVKGRSETFSGYSSKGSFFKRIKGIQERLEADGN
jgi:hypothetical protein